jgi:hypothetical protein
VALGARAIDVASDAGSRPSSDHLAAYCACFRQCRATLISEHSLNREKLTALTTRAAMATWDQREQDRSLLLQLSLADLGDAVQVWGDEVAEGDADAFAKLVLRLAKAEGYALTALAIQGQSR